jgi:hypothetical protein
MIWPTVIVDNFFDNPHEIIKASKNFTFKKDLEGRWPGERSDDISILDNKMFNWINYKIVRLLYPMDHQKMSWKAIQYFQKVDGNIYNTEGWVHSDSPMEFTVIIYLSNHKNCGTSLFDKTTFFNSVSHLKEKQEMYLKKDMKNGLKNLKKNNEKFEKKLTINSRFNRLVLFDSNQFHAADSFKEEKYENEERFTLITFFSSLNSEDIKYPITEMKRDY